MKASDTEMHYASGDFAPVVVRHFECSIEVEQGLVLSSMKVLVSFGDNDYGFDAAGNAIGHQGLLRLFE